MQNNLDEARLKPHGVTFIPNTSVTQPDDYLEWLPGKFVRIEPGSPVIGKTLEQAGIPLYPPPFTPSRPRRLARKTEKADWD
jgi:hypothetical protein